MTVIEGITITTQPPTRNITINVPESNGTKIVDLTHPDYKKRESDWALWRLTYEGGQDFIEEYLQKFSKREDADTFRLRKKITPIPAFAKAAINDIKNAIYQRTAEITRKGGPTTYQKACLGELGGVDLAAGTMNWLIGNKIIPELLTMGKVGLFIDNPSNVGTTVAEKGVKHPYLYTYKAEDVRNWVHLPNGEFQSILLRAYKPDIDPATQLPKGIVTEFRRFWLDQGKVQFAYYNDKSEMTKQGTLNIPKIPFIVFEISDSLLTDVARHQIALLNLESSDIIYALLANYPFYIEQADGLANSHLKRTNANGDVCTDDGGDIKEVRVGTTVGRQYGKGLNAPDFIAPPTEPLKVSMEKQGKLKEDIRLLVNLSLSSVKPKMASAESKELDQHGLESGLSYIGLELEHGERLIPIIWALYENSKEVATVVYPKRYSLKSDEERQKEAEQLAKRLHAIPSLTYQKEILKQIVTIMIADKVANETLTAILNEIDDAKVIISDPETITLLIKEGLLTRTTGAKSLFIPEGEVANANQEHAERLKRIAISQSQGAAAELTQPAKRGLGDLE